LAPPTDVVGEAHHVVEAPDDVSGGVTVAAGDGIGGVTDAAGDGGDGIERPAAQTAAAGVGPAARTAAAAALVEAVVVLPARASGAIARAARAAA
jgi:hypothetical protein